VGGGYQRLSQEVRQKEQGIRDEIGVPATDYVPC
jgi:hypothetical protein